MGERIAFPQGVTAAYHMVHGAIYRKISGLGTLRAKRAQFDNLCELIDGAGGDLKIDWMILPDESGDIVYECDNNFVTGWNRSDHRGRGVGLDEKAGSSLVRIPGTAGEGSDHAGDHGVVEGYAGEPG